MYGKRTEKPQKRTREKPGRTEHKPTRDGIHAAPLFLFTSEREEKQMQNARKRKDGRLEKRITVNGQRVSIYARSMKELREKENAKRAEIASGAYLHDAALTVDRYFSSEKPTERGKPRKTVIL